MRKMLLIAAATMMAGAILLGRAGATAATPPFHLAGASLVHEAAIVCGGTGCNPVQTKAVKRRKFKPLGYTKPI